MKERMFIDGVEVSVDIGKKNFSKMGFDFEGSEFLIYNGDDGVVYVDERADDEYIKYAALHEAICQGPYKELAPKCDNPNCRCLEIDKKIIGLMPYEERGEYARKRIAMFNLLLDKNINPGLNNLFKESLEGLKKM